MQVPMNYHTNNIYTNLVFLFQILDVFRQICHVSLQSKISYFFVLLLSMDLCIFQSNVLLHKLV